MHHALNKMFRIQLTNTEENIVVRVDGVDPGLRESGFIFLLLHLLYDIRKRT